MRPTSRKEDDTSRRGSQGRRWDDPWAAPVHECAAITVWGSACGMHVILPSSGGISTFERGDRTRQIPCLTRQVSEVIRDAFHRRN
jgi:hypothetical protein